MTAADSNHLDPKAIRTVQKPPEIEISGALEQSMTDDPYVVLSRIEAEQRDLRLDVQSAIRLRGKTDTGIFRRLDHLDNTLENSLPALGNSTRRNQHLLDLLAKDYDSLHSTQRATDAGLEFVRLAVEQLQKETKAQRVELAKIKEKRLTLTHILLLGGFLAVILLLFVEIYTSSQRNRETDQIFRNQMELHQRLERLGG